MSDLLTQDQMAARTYSVHLPGIRSIVPAADVRDAHGDLVAEFASAHEAQWFVRACNSHASLLAALEAALEALEALEYLMGEQNGPPLIRAATEQVRQAIQEAKG